ncbi:MAG: bifunctional 4-hydroxy-3-methylbut-2-enyl diphosphate reductase/30S ribosomal protein S1 [Peptococcaceae bacterium]|jgi:4-hydroxy-3-methylbut-2-enyl diphosphate reductase|nr:bifunctional 4-hydroxy-3-methylbut-2-enyl diphosphate reductase/30S ribosomal protein S1 [Peptococcaceae bacterium]
MKVLLASKAGFCFGVRRAIGLAMQTAGEGGNGVVSLGPLIHNRLVIDQLETQGVRVIDDIAEARPGQRLIIRSHGVPPEVYAQARAYGLQIIDATCPFVQKAQRLAANAAQRGSVIVVGDKSHPEVQGILGWAGPEAKTVESLAEAQALPQYEHLSILAQTTLPQATFEEIAEEVQRHTTDLTVHNTICYATTQIQQAAVALANQVDMIVVVGGKNSANTRKLKCICQEKAPTYWVETADELRAQWFQSVKNAGLTAGASTPDWIIEEVFKAMSELNEQDIELENEQQENEQAAGTADLNMDNWDEGFQDVYRGSIVEGVVVKINDNDILLDIGWKSEGIVALRDLAIGSVDKPEQIVALGDKVRAVIIRKENEEGYPILSVRRARELEAVDQLKEAFENKTELQAKVTEVVKGGLLVDVGMRGFIPASQVQIGYVNDLNQFLGETLRLRMIEFDQAKKKVILSQKVILQEEQVSKREHLLETLHEGDIIDGKVCRLVNFGAFVDIGGVDGLLHISDLAYSRIKHPSEIVHIGDEIKVQVLKIDLESGKISLGYKQLKEDPWADVEEKYAVGNIVSGTVVRLAAFGAFVQLEDGVDALVHISQLANRRVEKPEEAVSVGEVIQAKVLECKPAEKRISLSIREIIRVQEADEQAESLSEQEEIPQVTIGEAVAQATQDSPAPVAETVVDHVALESKTEAAEQVAESAEESES